MEMEQRGEQSISLSMSRIAEMATSAVTKREKVVKSSETERKERMDTSSLMEQMVLGGFFNSLIGCFATIDNPCINI